MTSQSSDSTTVLETRAIQGETSQQFPGLAQSAMSDYRDVPTYERPFGSFVSLYAGAGGLDIGFALSGFAPAWVSELDPVALSTHDLAFDKLAADRPHLQGAKYRSFAGDLLSISEEDLPGEGSADLVIGGPPCQGFSVAGKMDPEDERSKHVFHFMDIVQRVKPKAFVMENVKSLYSNRRWEDIRKRLRERADELNFNAEMYLMNASHFGVPQSRERMLFIGIAKGIGHPTAPEATTLDNPPTVREAFTQLPRFGLPGNDSFCKAKITTAKSPVLRRSPFAGMLFNGAGRPLNLDMPSSTLPASMGGNKTPIVDQRALENSAWDSWVIEYHEKLWEFGPAAVSPYVPDFLRRLTVEEAAVIQTFPMGMKWCGPQSAAYRQIGNAVPPRLGLAAGEAVKNALGNR